MTRTRCAALTLVVLGVTSGLTACVADEPAVCDDVDAMNATMDDLRDVEIGENALSVLSTELSELKSEADTLVEDASEEYATEIDAVRSGLTSLESDLEAAVEQPTAASLAEVSEGVQGLGASVDGLVDAVQETC